MSAGRERQAGGVISSIAVAVVVVVVGAAAFWWFVIRSDAAPEPKITRTNVVAGGTLDGTWIVKPGDLLGSFVQYRVKEQFVGALEDEATGRTSNDQRDAEGERLDRFGRHGRCEPADAWNPTRCAATRRSGPDGLQSNQFPTATFVLTEPIELGSVPAKGKKITTDATGDFTLHGVTKRVTIPLEGRWDGETVQVVGKLPIQFADYGITPPNIGGFVTVADEGRMELQLFFLKR